MGPRGFLFCTFVMSVLRVFTLGRTAEVGGNEAGVIRCAKLVPELEKPPGVCLLGLSEARRPHSLWVSERTELGRQAKGAQGAVRSRRLICAGTPPLMYGRMGMP